MLTPAQAAFLAGLPQRPSTFNPYRNPTPALARQRDVLRRMATRRRASVRSRRARRRDERLSLTTADAPFAAPHFVEMVLAATGGDRGRRASRRRSMRGLQAEVAGIIRSQRAVLDRHGAAQRRRRRARQRDAANGSRGKARATTSTPRTAARSTASSSPRQPGSALKPFTYALGFEEGFTPGDRAAPTSRRSFPTAEAGVLYSPRNYDGRYRGPLLARRALAGSENVPAVALASQLGVPKLLRFLLRAGFTTFDRNASYYGLGVTLGNAEVRLDELVAALRGVRARRRVDRADVASRTAGRRIASAVGSSRRGPRSGSPTSSRTPRRASSSSAAAAASSSRSRWR